MEIREIRAALAEQGECVLGGLVKDRPETYSLVTAPAWGQDGKIAFGPEGGPWINETSFGGDDWDRLADLLDGCEP